MSERPLWKLHHRSSTTSDWKPTTIVNWMSRTVQYGETAAVDSAVAAWEVAALLVARGGPNWTEIRKSIPSLGLRPTNLFLAVGVTPSTPAIVPRGEIGPADGQIDPQIGSDLKTKDENDKSSASGNAALRNLPAPASSADGQQPAAEMEAAETRPETANFRSVEQAKQVGQGTG